MTQLIQEDLPEMTFPWPEPWPEEELAILNCQSGFNAPRDISSNSCLPSIHLGPITPRHADKAKALLSVFVRVNVDQVICLITFGDKRVPSWPGADSDRPSSQVLEEYWNGSVIFFPGPYWPGLRSHPSLGYWLLDPKGNILTKKKGTSWATPFEFMPCKE